jgi:hypothetical protein
MAVIPEQGSIHNAKAANAGVQLADIPRIDANKLIAADGGREKLAGLVKRKKSEEDEFQNTSDDAGVTTEEVAAAQDSPMLLAQAETAGAEAASSAAGGGAAGAGAASAGTAAGGAAGAEAAAGLAFSDATLGTIILAGTVGVAAAAGGGGAAAAAAPSVGFVLSGVIALGQVTDNTGLTIEAFKADGTALAVSSSVVNANGTFTIHVTEDYTGPVLIRLIDTNAGVNYNDEGTGAASDIATDLRTVVNVSGSNNAVINVAITPLTELAVRELLGDGGGDLGTSGTDLTGVTTTQVTAANDSIKTAFGLTGDIVTTTPVTVDAAGFGTATAAQQVYGHVLAAIAGMETSQAQSTGTVLNTLSQNLTGSVLGQAAVDQLLAGAAVVDGVAGNAGGTTTALTAVIGTNISGIAISADTGTAGDFITQTAVQTITATLDVALSGTKLWGSVDNGTTWTDISGFVAATTLTWTGVTLAAGDNVVKLAVTASTLGVGTVPPFTGATADLVAGTKISMQTVALDTTAPAFAVSAPTFAENLTGVAYAPAVTDAHLVTYTLGGTDAASFTIDPNSGKVSFINSPNFEAPTDLAGAGSVAGDNFYNITVTATDGAGNVTANPVTIEVTGVNEAPTLTSGAAANFAENGAGTVYTAAATDPDAGATLTYALAGTDAALFNINATTGAVTFAAAPNFEAPTDAGADNVYNITVTASDGTNTTAAQAVVITVTNVNETPTLTSLAAASFAENGTGTVYTATATDPDAGAVLTYALGGTDAASFDINATTGAVTFKVANTPNREAPTDLAGAGSIAGDNIYDITVTASDGTITTAPQAVAITVTNVNEAPTVVTQNAPATMTLAVNQAITTNNDVSAMFADVDSAILTYSATGLPTGVTLNPTTGLITGTPTATVTAASVVITASDGALSVSHTIAVSVVTAPVISGITANVAQATSGNGLTFTATLSEAVAVTGTPTLTLDVGGTAMTATYSGGTGTNTLTFTATAPATGTDSTVTVSAITLGGGATVIGNTTGQPLVTTTVGQVISSFVVDNSAPVFTSATAVNAAENQTAAYTAAVTDATAVSYGLGTTGDNTLFTISNAGVVTFNANATPNFEVPGDTGTPDNVYNITVTAMDALGHATNQNVAITVTNVNEAPALTSGATSAQTLPVNQAFSSNVSGLFADPDAATTLTYSATGLPTGVTINATTGVISGTPATTGTVPIVITASDGTLTVDHTVTVTVVTAPTLASTIDNVTNFDVTSNIVLTSSPNVTAVAGKYIHIINDANDANVSVVATLVPSTTTPNAVGDTIELMLSGASLATPLTHVLTAGDLAAGSYTFIVPSSASDTLGFNSPTVTTTGAGTITAQTQPFHIGFHGEATINTQDILVTDATQVTIDSVNNTITINPGFDLDLANNYHITVDAGAFASGGVASIAVTDAAAMNFSTVTPAEGVPVGNAASQAMNAAGTLVSSYSWMDIQGIGAPSSPTGTVKNLSTGNIAMVFKDYDTTTVAGGAFDGIGAPDFYVSATNFGAGDLLYVDNQLNTQANSLASTSFFNDTPANAVTQISFGTGVGGLGGLVEVTPVGGTTPSFLTAAELQTLLAVSYMPIISA